jgi:hypothetical protein
MSTKTTFKRVALVAVAALGLGVLSVAPSSAAALSVTVTPSATTSAIKTGETATISLTVSGILGAAADSLTVVGIRTKGTSGTVNFNGTTDSTTTQLRAGDSTGAGAVLASGAYSAGGIALDTTTVSGAGTAVRAVVKANLVAPSTAGTYEVTIYTATGTNGTVPGTKDIAPFVWTITVTADSTSADATSSARLVSGLWTAQTDPSSDASVTASKAASASVPSATIKVLQKNATSSANEGLVVTLAGPGYLVSNNTTDTSTVALPVRVLSISAPGVATPSYIKLLADGTTGVSTVTITGATSGVVLGTKTVTFSDTKPASIAVTVKKAYVAAGLNTTKVFAVTLKDSAGNAITGTSASISGSRTDTTTAAGKAVATAASACSYDSTDKVYYCDATGASTIAFGPSEYKFTATGTDADATTVSAVASTTYSDVVATSVTITAPATAQVGDKVTWTLTAKEKNGYPIADGSYEGGTANGSRGALWNTTTVPAYTSTVTPFNAGETVTTVSGVATKSIYVPAIAGTITGTWTLGGTSTAATGAIALAIAGTTVTTTTVVANPGVDAATDAANEATDAANAATDAALAAADAADAATMAAQEASDAVAALSASVSKLIASLKAQITSLTNLVIKIQKKVKA